MLDSSIDGPNPNSATNGGLDETIEQLHRQVSGYEGSTLGQPSKNYNIILLVPYLYHHKPRFCYPISTYILDVLWGQPIKLIQVASCMKINGTNLFFLNLFPLIASGPQKYKHKIGHQYFSIQNPKKLGAFF